MKTISRYIMTLLLLITAAAGAWAADTYTVTFKANGNTKTVENVTLPHTFELDPIITELYPSLSGGHGSPAGTSASGNTNVTAYYNNDKHYATISASFEGAVTVTGQFFKDFTNNQYTLEINCMEKLVAISDDKTEATIKMPQYDLTASYTLKRDMSVDMPVTVQDAEQNSRFRVQKQNQGNTFVPVGMNMAQIVALFTVYDDIEKKNLTANTDFTVQLFAADDNDQPIGEAIPFNDFTFAPGNYVAKAVAADGSNYSGETALSNVFTLFLGYEVEVPAGEYVTYYKNEALYVEDTDAKLYTITAVNGDKATATELNVAAAGTPLLVKNNGSDTKTIVLIPTTTDTPDDVTAYSGFTGTLEATQIAASDANQNNYAFNGKEFVWVKTAIPVAANKAWLEVPVTASAAPQIRLIFSSTTGIESVDREQSTVDGWYDLSGRRLPGKPTKKGVYIVNGKKMVVK